MYTQDDTALRLMVADIVRHARTVLDVGCGTGYFARTLPDAQVDGVESHDMSAAEAETHARKLFVGSIEDELLRAQIDGTYEAILCIDVLEHLYDPVGTLRFLMQRIERGGILVTAIPNIAHVSSRLHLLRGRFQYEEEGVRDWTHLRFFTYRTARHAIESAGLQVMDQRSIVALPRAMRLLPSALVRRFPNLFAVHSVLVCQR